MRSITYRQLDKNFKLGVSEVKCLETVGKSKIHIFPMTSDINLPKSNYHIWVYDLVSHRNKYVCAKTLRKTSFWTQLRNGDIAYMIQWKDFSHSGKNDPYLTAYISPVDRLTLKKHGFVK